jgi:TolB-like protein
MAEERAQRRLAAILAADVVGFSRLMESDEVGTLAALKARRKEVLEPLVAKHHGRVFKVTGDGVLIEFASAVNAVQCAVDLQQAMAAAKGDQPDDHPIVLRIGVNLGDVLVEGSDLYGDGVNIAVRLETIAEPGGIYVSEDAHRQVRNKLQISFDDLGAQTLKNIAEPVRTYRVAGTPAVAVVVARSVSDRPSIAVLPFTNMSGDAEQEYFSDGITEDIITELSRYRSLLVIARNSSFQFRGTVNIADVRRALGVRYVVEGSVRKAGGRVRVTAQLIDAATQIHLWAERYDRDAGDIFALQDEITRTIAATLEGRVAASGIEHAKHKATNELTAYDYFLRGRERDSQFDLASAAEFYQHAIDLDPAYTNAHAFLALSLAVQNWLDPQQGMLDRAEGSARRALALDNHNPASHVGMAYVALHRRQFDLAGMHLDHALKIHPNDPYIIADRASWLTRTGRPAEALAALDVAFEYDPFAPTWFYEYRANAMFHLHRYDDAIRNLQKMTVLYHWHHAHLASAYAHAGQGDDARRELAVFLAMRPEATCATIAAIEPYADPALLDHLLNGMRKAGLRD